MSRVIIGFAGRMHSGKTTAAKELVYIGFTRVRFAGPLKAMMLALGLTEEEIDTNPILKEHPCELLCGKSPRYAMQTIGTEWGRNIIGQDLWINAWKRAVSKLPAHIPVTVDDVRFENEAEAIRYLGGKVVRIIRPETDTISLTHDSERMDFPVDEVIENCGTRHEFLARVRSLKPGWRDAA